jgi:electron transfer flavoprotein beta subunit
VKVLVAVKAVASLHYTASEWDACALEAALVLLEQAGDGEVVAVSVGNRRCEDALLGCLARGADRAVRVWDDQLADPDVLVMARVLAAVVERERPDLVLCGAQSTDAANAATGVAVAGFAGLPRVAVVTRLAADSDAGGLVVERELEGGLSEVLRVRLPALLTVQTGINHPRHPNFRALRHARDKPMVVCSPADLGLDPDGLASLAGPRSLGPRVRELGDRAQMLAGSSDEVAARILEIVYEQVPL